MKEIVCPYCPLKFIRPISLDLFTEHLNSEHAITIGKRGMVKRTSTIMPKKEREFLLKMVHNIKGNNKVKLGKVTRIYRKVKKTKIRIIATAFESSRR